MLQAELKVLGGKHQGKTIPLNTKKFLVGREQDCHLRPNSDLVSRHHCVFAIDDYAVRLRDLGSTNGTLVNGTSLRGEVILKSGDRITIGKLEVEMVIRQVATKAAPLPPAAPAIDAASVETPVEIATPSEEIETSYEMPVFQTGAPAEAPSDTAIIGAPQQYIPPMGYPPGYPQMMPPGYPMAGGYMPPQYPQYAPGYGQAPSYGQPMGYPMGFPQMMPMQPGFPGAAVVAPAPAAAVQEVAESPATDAMAVRLPDPADTGVKPAAAPQTAAAGAKKEEKPSTSAADIIKQYMNRRS